MKWTPHKYQVRAVKFLLSQGAAGLFMDCGLGKTSVVLAVLKILKTQHIVRKTLIVAPLRVVYNVWEQEGRKWDEFKSLSFTMLHGPKKDEMLRRDVDIYLINIDGFAWLMAQKDRPEFDVLVVDESTLFKNTSTARFKLMRRCLNEFRRRYILTGTPVPNGYLQLFGQIFILDQGAALGRYMTHYKNAFFSSSGYGGYTYTLNPGSEARINAAVKPLVLRLAAEDYLEVPPIVTEEVRVTLPKKAMKIYKDLERDFVAQITATQTVTAVNAAALSSKIRQIASGGLYYSDPRKTTFLHDAKTDAVEEIVESLQGAPCIVCYDTHHDLERLRKRFGAETPSIGGGVSPTRTKATVKQWNQGVIPVLLVQPQAAGHGLNLQEGGHHLIWHSLTWDLEVYDQMMKRIWRQGQKRRVFMYHILADKTIDDPMLVRLREKRSIQDVMLAALK